MPFVRLQLTNYGIEFVRSRRRRRRLLIGGKPRVGPTLRNLTCRFPSENKPFVDTPAVPIGVIVCLQVQIDWNPLERQ